MQKSVEEIHNYIYYKYASLAAAIEAAEEEGKITLIDNVTFTEATAGYSDGTNSYAKGDLYTFAFDGSNTLALSANWTEKTYNLVFVFGYENSGIETTSASHTFGVVTSTFMIGSNKIGFAFFIASLNAKIPAILNAISEESTS